MNLVNSFKGNNPQVLQQNLARVLGGRFRVIEPYEGVTLEAILH